MKIFINNKIHTRNVLLVILGLFIIYNIVAIVCNLPIALIEIYSYGLIWLIFFEVNSTLGEILFLALWTLYLLMPVVLIVSMFVKNKILNMVSRCILMVLSCIDVIALLFSDYKLVVTHSIAWYVIIDVIFVILLLAVNKTQGTVSVKTGPSED